MANLQPNQDKLGASHHLSLHKVVDIAHILEFVHEFSKISGLRVPRKHGIIHYSQGTVAEVEKSSSLGGSILKLNNTSTTTFVFQKINIIIFGKTKKGFNPRIHSLLFSGIVQKGTYEKKGKNNIAHGETQKNNKKQ
jgi:hypothetical protein